MTTRTFSVFLMLSFVLEGCAPLTVYMNEDEASEPTRVVSSPRSQAPKKRILVLPFENESELPTVGIHSAIRQELRESVLKNPGLIWVDVTELEQAFSKSGAPSSTSLEPFRAHGVDAIITGTVRPLVVQDVSEGVGLFQSTEKLVTCEVQVQVTDVTTQQTVVSRTFTAQSSEERSEALGRQPASLNIGSTAMHKVARNIASSIPDWTGKIAWAGRIVQITQSRYIITGGNESGLKPGQLLRVSSPPREIIDPMSRVQLGVAPGATKGVLRIVENFGKDASVAVLHVGAGFLPNDVVTVQTP